MRDDVRAYVLARDGGCVARLINKLDLMRWPMLAGLPDPGLCADQWGRPLAKIGAVYSFGELDHVEDWDKPNYAQKPLSDPDHLWTLCSFHHRGKLAGYAWATLSAVREAAPKYIAAANERARLRGITPPMSYEEVGTDAG